MRKSIVKKMFDIGVFIILIGCLSMGTIALYDNEESSEHYIKDSITISVEDGNSLSADQIERFANAVIAYHCEHEVSAASTPYGLTCVLLGHDTTTKMISVIEHKVRASNPRCLETKYNVTICNRCDYENIEYVLDKYISCCD